MKSMYFSTSAPICLLTSATTKNSDHSFISDSLQNADTFFLHLIKKKIHSLLLEREYYYLKLVHLI